MTSHVEVMDMVAQMKAAEQAFVLATVVRTVSVTAAKGPFDRANEKARFPGAFRRIIPINRAI
jgi:hypothetical protein